MSRWMRQQRKRARRAKIRRQPVAVAMNPEVEAMKYVPVLARMVAMLRVNPKLSYGESLARAARDLSVQVPERMHGPLLRSAFKITVSSKPLGA